MHEITENQKVKDESTSTAFLFCCISSTDIDMIDRVFFTVTHEQKSANTKMIVGYIAIVLEFVWD